jgi:hypothetical protein
MLIKNSKKTTVLRKTKALHASEKAAIAAPQVTKASWKESRPEVVARAKKLLKNPGYPSAKVLNSVARLLARHLT